MTVSVNDKYYNLIIEGVYAKDEDEAMDMYSMFMAKRCHESVYSIENGAKHQSYERLSDVDGGGGSQPESGSAGGRYGIVF